MAQARGETVHLGWQQPPVPGVTVTEWRVSRNGVPQNVVYQPSFTDAGGAGVHLLGRGGEHRRQRIGRVGRGLRSAQRPVASMVLQGAPTASDCRVAADRVLGLRPGPGRRHDRHPRHRAEQCPGRRNLSGHPRLGLSLDLESGQPSGRCSGTVPCWGRPGRHGGETAPLTGTHRYTIRALDSSGDRSAATAILVDTSKPVVPQGP